MTIAFNTEKLRKQFSSKKAFGIRGKRVSLRIDEIEDSENLKVLQTLPALNCRQLTNNPLDHWVLNITPGYSMIFLLDNDPIPLNEDGTLCKELVTHIRIIGFATY